MAEHVGTALHVIASGLAVLMAKSLGKLVTFGLAAYLVRYLGPASAGEYTLVFTYLGLVGVVGNHGIGNVMVRQLSRDEPRPGVLIGSALALRLGSALVAAGLAVAMVFLLPYSAGTRFLVILALPVLLVSLDTDSFVSTCARLFQVGARLLFPASLEVLTALLWAGSIVALVQLGATLEALVVVQALVGTPAALLLLLRLRRAYPTALALDGAVVASVVRASVPIGLAGALAMIYSQADVVLLSLMAPDSQTSIGYYAAAFRTTRALNVVPIAVQMAIFSGFCVEYACSKARFRASFESVQRYVLACGVPLSVLLLGAAEPIVRLLFGDGFLPSVLALRLLAASVVFMWVNYLAFAGLVAMDRQPALLLVGGAMLVFNLLANLVAIPWFGLYGASAVTTLTEGLGAVVSLWLVSQGVGGYSVWPLAKLGLSGAVMILPLVILAHHVLIGVAVALVVYVGALLLLGAITKDDLRLVRQAIGPT